MTGQALYELAMDILALRFPDGDIPASCDDMTGRALGLITYNYKDNIGAGEYLPSLDMKPATYRSLLYNRRDRVTTNNSSLGTLTAERGHGSVSVAFADNDRSELPDLIDDTIHQMRLIFDIIRGRYRYDY